MKALLTRIKRLETVHTIERLPRVELQIGYLKKLPADYTGERHEVTAGRLPDGTYLWEELPGPPPVSEDIGTQIIRVILVGARMDGRTPGWRMRAHNKAYPDALNAAELERYLREDGAPTRSA